MQANLHFKKKKKKVQAWSEWSSILPKSLQARKTPPHSNSVAGNWLPAVFPIFFWSQPYTLTYSYDPYLLRECKNMWLKIFFSLL